MAKPTFAKRLGWRFEAVLYDLVCLLLTPFSFDGISAAGGWVLRKIGPLTSKHHIAKCGLKTAFPDASDAQINIWLRDQWDNIGRTFAEFPILHRVKVFGDKSRVTVKGLHHLEHLKECGEVAVMVSGHFANWEIMAAVISQSGAPVQVTYRRINNPYLDTRVQKQRIAYGINLLVPKSGPRGAKQLLDALQNGESVALLNDQKFNEGIAIPFFGVDAMTAPGPTRLAMKSDAPVLLFSTTRDKARFTVTIHDPFWPEDTGNRIQDMTTGTRRITAFIEDRIRETPAQWFWVHRRWPNAVYEKEG